MIEVKRLINDDTERGWYKLDGIDPDTGVGFGGEVYMISRHCAQVLDEFGMAPDHPGEIHAVYRLASQYEAAYLAAGMPGRENYTLCLYPEAAISNFDMKSGGLRSYEEPAPLATLKSIRSLDYKTRIEPTSTTEVNEQCKRCVEADTEERAEFKAAERDRIANLYGRGSPCAEIFLASLETGFREILSSPEWLGAPLIEDTSIEDAFNRMPVIDPPECGECTNYKFMVGKCKFEMGLKEPNTACTNEKFSPAGSKQSTRKPMTSNLL